jgi:hypothetical protein
LQDGVHGGARALLDRPLARTSAGRLRVETEPVPLSEIERAWTRTATSGRRLVVVPD